MDILDKSNGFKVIENVKCDDISALQKTITDKVSRIISTELYNDSPKINFSQRQNAATYG
jgi:hypothetical protein